jgi:NADPH-dependent curcumin reductase CurA
MINNVNRQFRLKRRPQGRVTRDDFDYVEASIPQLGPDQVLVRHLYL